jgi:hypothetical protein
VRSTLAFVGLGATVGIGMKLCTLLEFSSWEGQILPWILGAFVWQAIRGSAKAKPDATASEPPTGTGMVDAGVPSDQQESNR